MKTFEVGLIKTGTTSLGRAFEILGYRHKGWDPSLARDMKDNKWGNIFAAIDSYDAFQDLPWHDIDVRVLDLLYPGSKYIYLDSVPAEISYCQ